MTAHQLQQLPEHIFSSVECLSVSYKVPPQAEGADVTLQPTEMSSAQTKQGSRDKPDEATGQLF